MTSSEAAATGTAPSSVLIFLAAGASLDVSAALLVVASSSSSLESSLESLESLEDSPSLVTSLATFLAAGLVSSSSELESIIFFSQIKKKNC